MRKSLFTKQRSPTKARPKKPMAPIDPVNEPLMSGGTAMAGFVSSGVPSGARFSGTPVSSQGLYGNSLSIYVAPTTIANSVPLSVYGDHSNMVGLGGPDGVVTVADFNGKTGASEKSYIRVLASYLEDNAVNPSSPPERATENVSLYALAERMASGPGSTFASNIQVIDDSSGGGTVVGLEIDVDGNAGTSSSLGLGLYSRMNPAVGSKFSGGDAVLIDANDLQATWNKGVAVSGKIVDSGIDTTAMTQTPIALHMANKQLLVWNKQGGSARAWITYNDVYPRFEFYIDGGIVAHFP